MFSKLRKGGMLTSLVCLFLGIFLVLFPFAAMGTACKVIGGVVVVYSGIKLWGGAKGEADRTEQGISIFTAVFGLVLIFSPSVVISILPVLLGLYIVLQGAGGVKHALDLKNTGYSKWNVSLLISILMSIVGLVILFSPMGTAALVVKIFGGVLVVQGILGLMD